MHPAWGKRWVERLLHTHDTPARTAAAFALGVFFGFSPFLGLHTLLGLACAFAFKLNRVAALLGVYSNLPWILPGYYAAATLLGALLLGVEVPPRLLSDLMKALATFSWADLYGLAREIAPLFWAFSLGSTLGALILSALAYRLSLAMIVAHRRHAEAARIDEGIDK